MDKPSANIMEYVKEPKPRPEVVLRRKREQKVNRHSFIVEEVNVGELRSSCPVARLYKPRSWRHTSAMSLSGNYENEGVGKVYPRCGIQAKVLGGDREALLSQRRSMDLSDLESLRLESTLIPDSKQFWKTFGKSMVFVQLAIKSLDNLNDQIVQFIFSPKSSELDDNDLSPKDRETLKSSMVVMRRLLVDAQAKFRKMVEDNKRLAARIDTSIHAANEEVNSLRAELVDTSKRLSQISEHSSCDDYSKQLIMNSNLALNLRSNRDSEEIAKLTKENDQLQTEIKQLKQEMEELTECNKSLIASDDGKANEIKLDFIQTKQELNRAKEALQAMKGDRKRLKAEKLDLLHQMKQLYCTLEDKESELRDFIRNYEQRMRESDESIKQLATEKEDSEREKWEILKKAKETAERCVSLKTSFDKKEDAFKKLETELAEAQEQLRQLGYQKTLSSASEDSVLKSSSLDGLQSPGSEELPPYEAYTSQSSQQGEPESVPPSARSSFRSSQGNDSSIHSSINTTFSTPNLSSSMEGVTSPHARGPFHSSEQIHRGSGNEGIYVTIATDPGRTENSQNLMRKKKKSTGSFSKIFGKSRSRRSLAVSDPTRIDAELLPSNPRMSVLSQDNYQEKLSILEEAKGTSLAQWKAGHVLAWLEIDMNMPMYGKTCLENIKSGKVLLGLSDSELDSALCLSSALHRRKLRLAIEEHRDPSIVKYAKAPTIDHTFIAHRWIHDLGLPQYSPAFEAQLLDGRILNVLTKKDLEKHLGVHRKFHQASILHGVELLRRVNFDKELLTERRSRCEESDCDPLVWSNHRLIRWINSIDLQEYSYNLKESGVHGAVLVLEPTFNSEAFAAALGIPPSKAYVKRHLATELETIIRPARAALEAASGTKRRPHTAGGSVGRSFVRSYRGGQDNEESSHNSGKRLSFRGSLGRVLGRKTKEGISSQGNSNGNNNRLNSAKRSQSIDLETTII